MLPATSQPPSNEQQNSPICTRERHEKQKDPFLCDHCGKSIRRKRTFNRHLRGHSSDGHNLCNLCQWTFPNIKTLRRHLVVHSDEQPLPCRLCGKKFRGKDRLSHHIIKTHNLSKKKAEKLANKIIDAEINGLNSKNQRLDNIPVSNVNPIEILNNIEDADNYAAIRKMLKNLDSLEYQWACLTYRSAQAFNSPLNGITGKASSSSNSYNESPPITSRVQASTSSNMEIRRRDGVIITVPLSPPTTRLSRFNEIRRTRSSTSRSGTLTGRQVYPGTSSSATSSKKTARARKATVKSKSPAPTRTSPKKKTKERK